MLRIIIFLLLISVLVSCTRNGYGCNGRSKIQTRVTECNPKDYRTKENRYTDKYGAVWYRHATHCHKSAETVFLSK